MKLDQPQPQQLTIIEMLSPTKCFVRCNKYFKTPLLPYRALSRQLKLSRESDAEYGDDWIKEQKAEIWLGGDTKDGTKSLDLMVGANMDWPGYMGYVPQGELKYSLDFDDGLVKCMCCITKMSREYKFVM
jgi:hypothetical protein